MAKVTGIGGVFIKAKGDHKALSAWYQNHLGIDVQSWGSAVFHWKDDPNPTEAATAWMVHSPDSEKFKPTEAGVIINYRVDDVMGIVENLKKAGIKVNGPDKSEYGTFAWVTDPEGNRVELWQQ